MENDIIGFIRGGNLGKICGNSQAPFRAVSGVDRVRLGLFAIPVHPILVSVFCLAPLDSTLAPVEYTFQHTSFSESFFACKQVLIGLHLLPSKALATKSLVFTVVVRHGRARHSMLHAGGGGNAMQNRAYGATFLVHKAAATHGMGEA